MSIPTLPPFSTAGRYLTAADVDRLPRTLATTDVGYELHDGKLVVLFPPDYYHARAMAHICAHLMMHGEKGACGEARGRVGVLLRRNPDHLLGPDAAFITTASLPPRLSPEGYLLTIPELVVEVRRKSNSQRDIDAKVRDYLAAGVALVWVADPVARTVTAHRPYLPPVVSAASDTLTADPVIPGFAVPVAELLP